MKRHYIYFALLPVILFVVFCLPFAIDNYSGMDVINNSFDDGFTWVVYTIPTLLATILLLIRNRVTAIIGASIYLMSFGLSIFMNIILQEKTLYKEVGIGARLILAVMLAATIISIIHIVKLFRNRERKPKENHEVLDDMF